MVCFDKRRSASHAINPELAIDEAELCGVKLGPFLQLVVC